MANQRAGRSLGDAHERDDEADDAAADEGDERQEHGPARREQEIDEIAGVEAAHQRVTVFPKAMRSSAAKALENRSDKAK